jgi:hypothetical protein
VNSSHKGDSTCGKIAICLARKFAISGSRSRSTFVLGILCVVNDAVFEVFEYLDLSLFLERDRAVSQQCFSDSSVVALDSSHEGFL